jgi:tRNA A-37 threonylcarbamoyl transferase component Bud32
MDLTYELYCLADVSFYDDPNLARKTNPDFPFAEEPVPAGWRRAEFGHWVSYTPEGATLPPQGWKVHVASCVDNAESVLATVCDYCLPRRIAFKFVRSPQHLFLVNTKYADRESSGKFVAIYPADESQLEAVLTELGDLLDGQPGPYILSDLRWASGPLYVRYGGFAERWCLGPTGELELAIEGPDGELIPDRRDVVFRVPEWVSLPAFLQPHLDARNGTTVTDMPYEIREALHFSNGGGVYVGYRGEERFVLKEARPHAGLDLAQRDAVARVRWERAILDRLAGLDVVPQVRDYFTYAGHEFLVEDFIEGEALNEQLVARYPLDRSGPDDPDIAAYTAWALDILGKVEAAVSAIHERGVVMGDLHPFNLIVRPDGRVAVIDFEGASEVSEARWQILANPAFAPPASRTGLDADRYALACLRLYLFLPITQLLALGSSKASELAAAIADRFGVPAAFLDETVHWISDVPPAERSPAPAPASLLESAAGSWRSVAASMVGAILSSATPGRDDRLFPGDPMQFSSGALNLAHGAAGVLYSLDAVGFGRYPAHEDWLVERALHPRRTPRFGFYDGLHGVAYALDRLGRRSEALEVLQRCRRELAGSLDRLSLDLEGGLAGIGLNLSYFASVTRDGVLENAADEVVRIVANRLGDEQSVPTVSGGEHPYAGLMRGSSGPALLFIRRYERTGDDRLLDLAATALRQDLRRCVVRNEATLEVDEGWRTLPYLAQGSVGIGFVLAEYLAHREDERFSEAAGRIRRAASSHFYVQAGLFSGRAGMILYLSHRRGQEGVPDAVADQIRRLQWHALAYEGHLAFPGNQLLRLSMDLATGTAGVLLALGAALHDEPVSLPFLLAGGAGGTSLVADGVTASVASTR